MIKNYLSKISAAIACLAALALFAWIEGCIDLPNYLPGPLTVVIFLFATLGLLTRPVVR